MAMISPPGPPALSIKAVVLTRITINEVEKLRKWPSLWRRPGCFLSTDFLNGATIFSLPVFFPLQFELDWTGLAGEQRRPYTCVCAFFFFFARATPA